MPKLVKTETYEKLRKAIGDSEAVMCLVRDLEEGIENYLKERAEYFENALYSKLVQKLVTKEEFKSELKRLDQKIDFVYQQLDQKIDFVYKDLDKKLNLAYQKLDQKINFSYNDLNNKIQELSKRMDYQYQALQSEIKRVEQNISTKFWILIIIMLIGLTLLNPYAANIIKGLISLIK